jgi:hypothetical protein
MTPLSMIAAALLVYVGVVSASHQLQLRGQELRRLIEAQGQDAATTRYWETLEASASPTELEALRALRANASHAVGLTSVFRELQSGLRSPVTCSQPRPLSQPRTLHDHAGSTIRHLVPATCEALDTFSWLDNGTSTRLCLLFGSWG